MHARVGATPRAAPKIAPPKAGKKPALPKAPWQGLPGFSGGTDHNGDAMFPLPANFDEESAAFWGS